MIPNTFTFYTIAEWMKTNPDIEPEKLPCFECNTTGQHTCRCGDEHDCCFCHGTGHAKGDTYHDLYKYQLNRDFDFLYKYLMLFIKDENNPVLINLEETRNRLIKESRLWKEKK